MLAEGFALGAFTIRAWLCMQVGLELPWRLKRLQVERPCSTVLSVDICVDLTGVLPEMHA